MQSKTLLQMYAKPIRIIFRIAIAIAALMVLSVLIWQGITASGNPDPMAPHLDRNAVILNTGLLVFREGLEAILVLAAITASLMGSNQAYRRPIAVGTGAGFLATIATWFIAIALINAVNAPALDIQAATGLLAILVLLVIMNWFFHKIYWTGWISLHNRRRKNLLKHADERGSRTLLGLALLGFSAMYREGFEVVLFLQNLRLQAGSLVVLQGVAVGLFFTAIVAVLTFIAHRRMPYKKMLVLTGVLLGMVLIVMVGESAQELQLAHWIATTPLNLPIPGWMGVWFAIFPTLETLTAQVFAGVFVIGSYVLAQYIRVWRPRQLGQSAAQRPENPPVTASLEAETMLMRNGH